MRIATALGLGLVLMTVSAQAQATKVREAAEKVTSPATDLTGTYDITSGEEAGKPVPEDKIKDTVVKVTSETMIVVDKDDKEVYTTKYTLDTSSKPYKITMTETGGPRGRKGAKAIGLIEADGDDVKLVYCYEGGIVPTEFKTKAGEKQLMFMMKKKATK